MLTAGAALAALLTTGAASAQPAPAPSCAEAQDARDAARALDLVETDGSDSSEGSPLDTNEPVADPDDSQIDPEGNPATTDGAADVGEGAPLDTDDGASGATGDGGQSDPEGDPTGPDGAADVSEGSPLDTDEAPVDPDLSQSDPEGNPAGLDGAADVPEEGEVTVSARNAAIAAAQELVNKACRGPQGEPGPVTAPVSTVWCVLKPGVCAEVRLDAQGRLVAVIRQVNCPTDNLPAPTGSRRGERVTVISAPAPGSVTILPSTGGVPQAPVPEIQSGGSYPAVTG